MLKRMISFVLCICLLASSMPLQAIAQTMPEKPQAEAPEEVQQTTAAPETEMTTVPETTAEATAPAAAELAVTEAAVQTVPETEAAPVTVPTEPATVETVPPTEAVTEPVPVETEPAIVETEPATAETEPTVPETEPEDLHASAEAAYATEGLFQYTTFTREDGTTAASISGYTGTEANVTIPSSIGGYPVVRIGAGAFYNKDTIVSIVIPEGVTEIQAASSGGSGAFYHCSKLTTVSLPSTLTKIGNYAFYQCGVLAKIAVPGGVERIGSYAFYDCNALTDVTLSTGLKSIDSYAFSNSEKLAELTLPSGLTTIGSYAFDSTAIAKLELPDTVTSLGGLGMASSLTYIRWTAGIPVVPAAKFYNYDKLQTVVLPEGVTEIAGGNYTDTAVFSSCNNLATVSLPSTLTKIGDRAFYQCPKLTDVTLPKNLKSINSYAFYNCSAITELVLPEGLTTIGSYALSGTAITRLELPDSVTSVSLSGLSGQLKYLRWTAGIPVIKAAQFYNWDALETIILPEGVTEIAGGNYADTGAFSSCNKLATVSLPSTLAKLGDRAFYQCPALAKITIPGSVERIGSYAFYDCNALTDVTLSVGLKTIDSYTFYTCDALTELTLPEGLTTVGSNAFGSSAIARLELPDTVTSVATLGMANSLTYLRWTAGIPVVPAAKFYNYDKLQTVVLPEGVTEIAGGYYADTAVFSSCNNLATVSLPSTLTKIGDRAFYQCPKLTNVELPASLQVIGAYAFYNCSAITELTLPDGMEALSIGSYAFGGTGITKLELPDSVTSASLSGLSGQLKYLRWSAPVFPSDAVRGFSKLETLILAEGVTEIGDGSSSYTGGIFSGCSSLTTVSLPSTLKKIGNYAFYDCDRALMAELELPEGLEAIGAYAFYDCDTLTDFALPESLKSIGKYAFYGCDKLALSALPDGLKTIDEAAFYNCKAITELALPDGLETIGASAFAYSGLTRLELPDSVTSVGQYALQGLDLTYVRWSAKAAVPATAFSNMQNLTTVILPEGITEIADASHYSYGAFYNCDKLTNLILPSTLTKIGAYAFYDCDISSLEALALPAKVTSIGEYAFANCDTIKTVTLPEVLTTLGSRAFYDCDALTAIDLPEAVTSIGSYAFANCVALTAVSFPKNLTALGAYAFYSCRKLTQVVLPDSLTVLEDSVFWNCDRLSSVQLPKNLTKIGASAFGDCSALTQITIPATVQSVGASAFEDCEKLMAIALPEGLTTVGNRAFYDCTALVSVTLPSTLESLGEWAFYNCRVLNSIILPDKLTVLQPGTFCYCYRLNDVKLPAALTAIESQAFYYCESLSSITLPEGLTSIGKSVFSGTALTKIDLPDSLTTLREEAFASTDLTEITIPAGVTDMGVYVFSSCGQLTKAVLPDTMTALPNGTFNYCQSLTDVTLPKGLTAIGSSAFANCTSLTAITLPETLTTIGSEAFYYSGLTAIELPDSLTELGTAAFRSCKKLKSIEIPKSITKLNNQTFWGCTNLEEVILPEGLTTLGEYEFDECTSLAQITLPRSLTSLGYQVFEECKALTSIEIPAGVGHLPTEAFRDCTALTEVVLPSGLESIGNQAFAGCTALKEIVLPDTVTAMDYSAFSGCTALESVTLPKGLTRLENSLFYNCSALKEIQLPDSVTSLGSSVFYNCTSLTDVALPEGLATVGDNAFSYCTSLTDIVLPNSVTSLGSGIFYYCTALKNVTLPIGLTTLPGSTFYYCTSLAEIQLPEGLKTIGSSAFSNCTSLSSITLPESLTTIDSYAFSSCTSLAEIQLPEGLKTIEYRAFSYCTSLSSITLPEGLTTINSYAFEKCTSLSSITLPESLTTLRSCAFYNCTGLNVVKAGQDLSTIESRVFYGCPNVTLFVWPGTMMEDYAIDNGLNYVYYNEFGNDGTLTVTLNPKLYEGMQLELRFADFTMRRTITTEAVYEFTGLGVGSECTIQVVNAFGNVVLKTGTVVILKETAKTLEDSKVIGNVRLRVTDDAGADKTGQVKIQWYDEAGTICGTGAILRGVLVGKALTARMELSAADGRTYYPPEEVAHTVVSGDNGIEVTLRRIPQIRITGRVTNGSQGVAGASVIVSRAKDGEQIAITDQNGNFAVTLPAGTVQLTVQAGGYAMKTLELGELSADTDLGEIALEAVVGGEVTLELQLNKTGGEPETLTTLDDLGISVRNVSRNTEIVDIWRQGMTLVLAEEASAGEALEITVSSLKNRFAPVSVSVTLDDGRKATASAALTEYGHLEVTYETTKNESVQLLVFREDGTLAASLTQEAKEKKLTTGLLKDGNYSVVLMGGSEFFVYPDTLEGLTLAGLTEGTDYAVQTAEVISGQIAQAAFRSVPKLNESQFYYTNPAKTIVSASKTTVSAGRFFTLRAATAFAAEYTGKMTDIQWVIQLPEGLEYYPGTLTVDKASASYEQIDNRIFVSVADPSLDLRLCLLATGSGEVSPAVYLQFAYEGKTVRQPVGAVTVQIDPFDFEVTEKTFDPSVTVIGTGAAGAQIQLYDNGVLVGQTKVNAGGSWKLTFDLYKPGTYSEHTLYAQMNVVTGAKVRSTSHTVVYQYSPEPVEVKTVTMFYNGRLTSVIDFRTGEVKGTSYSVAGSANITFQVDFDCPDMSLLSDVTLEVLQDDDQTRSMKAIYDAATGTFVTSGTFTMYAMPVNVAVSYVYDGELVFSGENINEIRLARNDIENALSIFDELNYDNEDFALSEISLDRELIVPMSESLKSDIEAYNQSVNEFVDLLQEFGELADYLCETVQETENGISVQGAFYSASWEKTELLEFSVEDKVKEGYSVYKVESGSDDYLLVRVSLDEMTGLLEQSVIDTSDNERVLACLSANKMGVDGLTELMPLEVEALQIPKQTGVSYIQTYQENSIPLLDWSEIVNQQTSLYERFDLLLDNMGLRANIAAEGINNYEKEASIKLNQMLDDFIETTDKVDEAFREGIYEDRKWINNVVDVVSSSVSNIENGAGAFANFVAAFKSAYSAGENIVTLRGEMGDLIKENNSAEVGIAKWQLRMQLATNVMASFAGIAGVAKWLKVLPALGVGAAKGANVGKVAGPWGLVIGGVIGALLVWSNNKTNTDINKVIQKYSDKAASLTNPLTVIRDPSGYIYEAVPSNRLPGVTVTCYEKVTKYDIYDEPYEEVEFWDAGEYNQRNPLTTDDLGQYAWDVPQGWWQVKAELPGYETTYSEWLPVPPPQLDVNLGMVSYAAPEISDLFAQTDSVEISFSRYLQTETLTTDNVSVTVGGAAVSGTLELLNAEAEPGDTGRMLASKVRFVPDEALEDGASVVVAISPAVLSYANVAAAQGERAETTVVTIPDELFVADTVGLTYQGSGIVTIQAQPAYLAAGQTVQVYAGSELMLQVAEQTVTLDENGTAVIHITGKLPGETQLYLVMNDGRLAAETTVRIQMPETGETLTDVESLTIAQDYVALYNGQTASLLSDIQPAKLADKVIWSVEEGGEKNIAVDAAGNVTALAQGTAWVLATVSDSEKTLTARCRVDVAGDLQLDGVRLSETKLTAELYSRDYAQVELLLLLPQNYGALSASADEQQSVAVEEAFFTGETPFRIRMLDDRTAQIIPTAGALENPKSVAKSYSDTITVVVDGKTYETEKLTLTVKQTMPKPKVTVDAFNSFYSGQRLPVQAAGLTVTEIRPDESAKLPLPEWLGLEEEELVLQPDAPQKNASGKAYLKLITEEWAVPIPVTVAVKNTYKAPGLKLSATNVQFSGQTDASQGIRLTLQPKDKKQTLDELRVTGISAPAGFAVEDYKSADGTFTLKTAEGFAAGKIQLDVTFGNTAQTLAIPLTVKTAQVKLKLAATSVTLNAKTGDAASVGITATPEDYLLTQPAYRLQDKAKNEVLDTGVLEIGYENGRISVSTTEETPAGQTYKLYISAGGSKEVVLTIKTVDKAPALKLKQTGDVDLSFPKNAAVIAPAFTNYGGRVEAFAYRVMETKSGTDVTEQFTLEKAGSGFSLTCVNPAEMNEKGAYTLTMKLTLPNGETLESSLKLKVKRTALKLKLSSAKLTLNKAVNDSAAVTITCTTKGYVFTKPIWDPVEGLDLRWNNGKLQVSTNAETQYGATYKVNLRAEAGAAATVLTVAIPKADKSAVTSTLKLKGNLDIIRDGSSVIATATYKNCAADAKREEALIIVDSGNADVTKLFSITKNADGTFTIQKAKEALLDIKEKYQVKLVTTFGETQVESKPVKLTVKMGSAKLTAVVDGAIFAKDRHSRLKVRFTSTDAALNGVSRMEIKDAKYKNLFEIFDYGNGEFAIGVAEGANPGTKPVNLTLDVYLKGNGSAKANASVKVKVSIVP